MKRSVELISCGHNFWAETILDRGLNRKMRVDRKNRRTLSEAPPLTISGNSIGSACSYLASMARLHFLKLFIAFIVAVLALGSLPQQSAAHRCVAY